jgi:hypothetical protein
VKWIKKLLGIKEQITFQEFTTGMVLMGNSLLRGKEIAKLYTETVKARRSTRDKIYIEINAIRYWLQCLIMQSVLKSRGFDWKKAVDEFDKRWVELYLGHDELPNKSANPVCDLLNDKVMDLFERLHFKIKARGRSNNIYDLISPLPLSHEEFTQILRDRTVAYYKAFTEKKKNRMGKGWPLEQLAYEMGQNFGVGRDSRELLKLAIQITATVKYHKQTFAKALDLYDLSFLGKSATCHN